MSYGADRADIFGMAASYVDRIMRCDKPADLPVHAPRPKFETAVNLKTAKAPGLTEPPGLLVDRRRGHRMTGLLAAIGCLCALCRFRAGIFR